MISRMLGFFFATVLTTLLSQVVADDVSVPVSVIAYTVQSGVTQVLLADSISDTDGWRAFGGAVPRKGESAERAAARMLHEGTRSSLASAEIEDIIVAAGNRQKLVIKMKDDGGAESITGYCFFVKLAAIDVSLIEGIIPPAGDSEIKYKSFRNRGPFVLLSVDQITQAINTSKTDDGPETVTIGEGDKKVTFQIARLPDSLLPAGRSTTKIDPGFVGLIEQGAKGKYFDAP